MRTSSVSPGSVDVDRPRQDVAARALVGDFLENIPQRLDLLGRHQRLFQPRGTAGEERLHRDGITRLDLEHGRRGGIVVTPGHCLGRHLELMCLRGGLRAVRLARDFPGEEEQAPTAPSSMDCASFPLVEIGVRCVTACYCMRTAAGKEWEPPARSASKGGPCWRCGLGVTVFTPRGAADAAQRRHAAWRQIRRGGATPRAGALIGRVAEADVARPARPEHVAGRHAHLLLAQQSFGKLTPADAEMPDRQPQEQRPGRPRGIQVRRGQPFKAIAAARLEFGTDRLEGVGARGQGGQRDLLTKRRYKRRPQRCRGDNRAAIGGGGPPASRRGAEARAYPLLTLPVVSVRRRALGSVPMLSPSSSWRKRSKTSSLRSSTSCRSAHQAICSRSSAEWTPPVGLAGERTISIRARGERGRGRPAEGAVRPSSTQLSSQRTRARSRAQGQRIQRRGGVQENDTVARIDESVHHGLDRAEDAGGD